VRSSTWSFEQLSEGEQLLFARLPIFACGWTLRAAEVVRAGDGIGESGVRDLSCRRQRGEQTFEEEWNAGRAMSTKETSEYAQSTDGEAGWEERAITHPPIFRRLLR
jgi:hypothetical protein